MRRASIYERQIGLCWEQLTISKEACMADRARSDKGEAAKLDLRLASLQRENLI